MRMILTGLTVATLLATSMEARGGHRHHGATAVESSTTVERVAHTGQHHKGHHFMRLISQLSDLTTEQTEAIETAFSDERTAMETLRESRAGSHPILTAVSESGLDRENFLTLEAQFSAERANLKADTLETILATLTPEQISELIALIEAEVTEVEATESNTTAE
jgi:Spy/CpxP family protein refolding chaperone